jgi:hypothetical protein|tara:strand:- start:908 stop:1093 length:186 start_codon:yes stop_codon:yes gene_type:complete
MTLHYFRNSETTIAQAKLKALQAIKHNDPKGLTKLEQAFYHAFHPKNPLSIHAKTTPRIAS